MTSPIKVNFSEKEASSAARVIPPTGNYTVNITQGEERLVKPGKTNSGKPYWFLTLVVQEGQYAGTTLISSVMLFDGALYTLSQLLKALGYPVDQGSFEVPSLDDIIGKTVVIYGQHEAAGKDKEGKDQPERFNVKSFKPALGANKPTTNSTLLP